MRLKAEIKRYVAEQAQKENEQEMQSKQIESYLSEIEQLNSTISELVFQKTAQDQQISSLNNQINLSPEERENH